MQGAVTGYIRYSRQDTCFYRLRRIAWRRRLYSGGKVRVSIAYGAVQGAVSVAEIIIPTILVGQGN